MLAHSTLALDPFRGLNTSRDTDDFSFACLSRLSPVFYCHRIFVILVICCQLERRALVNYILKATQRRDRGEIYGRDEGLVNACGI